RELGYAHDVGIRQFGDRRMRFYAQAIRGYEYAGLRGYEDGLQQCGAELAVDNEAPFAADRREQVIHAVNNGRRCLRIGKNSDGRGLGRGRHGRFVRFVAESALAPADAHNYSLLGCNSTRNLSFTPIAREIFGTTKTRRENMTIRDLQDLVLT